MQNYIEGIFISNNVYICFSGIHVEVPGVKCVWRKLHGFSYPSIPILFCSGEEAWRQLHKNVASNIE